MRRGRETVVRREREMTWIVWVWKEGNEEFNEEREDGKEEREWLFWQMGGLYWKREELSGKIGGINGKREGLRGTKFNTFPTLNPWPKQGND